ncbi:MAG: NnrU family protein [Desulfobulbales bacterium]|nr:NnrU family protein [Desulfobulbales bacterium]
MKSGELILFWWFMFGATHMVGSSIPVRTFFIRRFGNLVFKAVYSVVALATFIPLCYAYFTHRHAGNLLYNSGYLTNLLAQFIMLAAFIVLLQGLVTANPMTTMAELTGRVVRSGRGIQRVTRHPQNFAFALFGLAHLLANPYVGDWIFFGGFILYGIASAIHQDRRLRATGPAQAKQFIADTSAIPFAAIISGRQRLAPGEYHPPALAAAIVLFILMRLLHPLLFGGFGS